MALSETSLNYNHLHYFWVVAREGGLVAASRRLRLSHSTLSTQIHLLEEQLGVTLFVRKGRRLQLTTRGEEVYRYATEIFTTGRELLDALAGRGSVRGQRLYVGVVDAVHKTLVARLLEPVLSFSSFEDRVQVQCREGRFDVLLAGLGSDELDVVIADGPTPAGSRVRAFQHALGTSDCTIFGARSFVRALNTTRASWKEAPFLLPMEGTGLRRAIDQFFEQEGIRPRVVGEFDDSALLKAVGAAGHGLFFAPSAVADDVERQYDVERVVTVDDVRESFYLISGERRLQNPLVQLLHEQAREGVFAPATRRQRP